jgi:H+/Cl- antiporter ClcA
MVYWDGQTYRASGPTLIPDIRAHKAIWRRFREATGTWPTLSIIAYLLRFIALAACVVGAIWYGERHNLTKGQGGLLCLAISLPVVGLWFLAEIQIWNYEPRRRGVGSRQDLWNTDQFPQK